MTQPQNIRKYDLEERTYKFAKDVRSFVKVVKRTTASIEDVKQLIRSSGSVGANYIEANDSLSKKDFILRVKICRKEAKESRYWLNLLDIDSEEKNRLIREVTELMNIFGAIIRKSE